MEGSQPAETAIVAPAPSTGRLVIDLLPKKQPRRDCPSRPDGEIVVCAEQEEQEQFRLRPLDPRFANQVDEDGRARVMIGNTEVVADTEAAPLAGGVTSKRVMIRAKIKF